MERRLKLLAAKGVRNIDQYNKLFDQDTPSLFEDAEEEKPIPYLVIIIDELADLMMLDSSNVEESITRLAQMARAVGIHLVLGTQRPSVDVITGLIKANFPARISFRVATKVDSRRFSMPTARILLAVATCCIYFRLRRVHRLHAPFVTEKKLLPWLSSGGSKALRSTGAFPASPKDERGNAKPEARGRTTTVRGRSDVRRCVRLVLEFGKASRRSCSVVCALAMDAQRHLIDLMENDGIVGAPMDQAARSSEAPDWITEVNSR